MTRVDDLLRANDAYLFQGAYVPSDGAYIPS